jgi:glycosyltransferase involved in cell wall biosynthesis
VAAFLPHGWEVIGLETAGSDSTYEWDETDGGESGARIVTAFPGRVYEEITAAEYRSTLFPLLEAIQPTHMAIAGWGSTDAQMCLSWCRKNDVQRIVMSETREADGERVWWKELLKRYLISRFDGALVGGKSHRDYLVKLGMPEEKIAFGYNVVHNAYFANAAADWRKDFAGSDSTAHRSQVTAHSPPYFLASNRFIGRKNLARLIEAYALYLESTSKIQNPKSPPWPLVLLGDGELKEDLIAQCHLLGLSVIESAPWESISPTSKIDRALVGQGGSSRRASPAVFFPSFRQIEELPRFYAHAGCFVHPALEEPWGLVLNEAMSCGLPILSGNNVGAAEELVDDGVNGWAFDATDVEAMEECLARVSALDEEARAAFGQASERILEARCPTGAFGRSLANLLIAPGYPQAG